MGGKNGKRRVVPDGNRGGRYQELKPNAKAAKAAAKHTALSTNTVNEAWKWFKENGHVYCERVGTWVVKNGKATFKESAQIGGGGGRMKFKI